MERTVYVGRQEEGTTGVTAETELSTYGDFSLEALCRRIHERHGERIKVKKAAMAVPALMKIVEAALKLSNRQGFHATSMRDLARESGLSMGGLYSYFDSKDDLLVMILGEVSASVDMVLREAPDRVRENPAEHLRWLITMHVALSAAMHAWFLFSYMEAKAFPPAARNAAIESELSTERIFAEVMERGVRLGRFAIEDIPFTAGLVKAQIQDWYVKRGKHRKRGLTAQGYAQRVSSFVMAAIEKRG